MDGSLVIGSLQPTHYSPFQPYEIYLYLQSLYHLEICNKMFCQTALTIFSDISHYDLCESCYGSLRGVFVNVWNKCAFATGTPAMLFDSFLGD